MKVIWLNLLEFGPMDFKYRFLAFIRNHPRNTLLTGILLILCIGLYPQIMLLLYGVRVPAYVSELMIPMGRLGNYTRVHYFVEGIKYTYTASSSLALTPESKISMIYIPGKPLEARLFLFSDLIFQSARAAATGCALMIWAALYHFSRFDFRVRS